jgi:ribonuclease P protein subunit RPR2
MSKKKNNKKNQKQTAEKRIKKLFLMAEKKALNKDISLANRYVQLARKISMKYLVPMPIEFKRRFCKHCYIYLLPTVNSRFRIHNKCLVIFCFNCQKYTRIPYKSKK